MAVVINVTNTTGTTRTFTLQDGQKLPPIALAAGERVSIVDQNTQGVSVVMDGDNVALNWADNQPAASFENLALYLQQESGSQIEVTAEKSGATTTITNLEELLAGFSTAAGGAAGGDAAGGGLTNSGAVDENGLSAGGGSPLDVGAMTFGRPGGDLNGGATEGTDPADGTVSVRVITTVEDTKGGIPGGEYEGAFEDAQANQHVGDYSPTLANIEISFAPADNESITSVTLGGLPAGGVLVVNGVNVTINPDGTATFAPLSGSEVGTIHFTPPADSDVDFTLTVSLNIIDPDSGLTNTIGATTEVVVDAAADLATIDTSSLGIPHVDLAGVGDHSNFAASGEHSLGTIHFTVEQAGPVTFDATSSGIDTYIYVLRDDGTVSVENIIDHNDDGGDGLNSHLTLDLAPGSYIVVVGDYYLSPEEVVAGINQDSEAGSATLSITGPVTIDSYSDNFTTEPVVHYLEDNATQNGGTYSDHQPVFDIGFKATANDVDGSEELTQVTVTLDGLHDPLAGGEGNDMMNSFIVQDSAETAVLWNGSAIHDGQVIQVLAQVWHEATNTITEETINVRVDIAVDGDTGVLTFTPVEVAEGGDSEGAIITPMSDDDALQVLALDLAGDGFNNDDSHGDYVTSDRDGGDHSGLQVQLPQHSDDDFTVTVNVTSSETNVTDAELTDANNTAVSTTTFEVDVRAVADAATDLGGSGSGNEDTAITPTFSATFADNDGSESHLLYASVPEGWEVTNANGWTLVESGVYAGQYVLDVSPDADGHVSVSGPAMTPPADSDVDGTVTLTAVAVEDHAEGGVASMTATSQTTVTIVVDAVADGTSITEASFGPDQAASGRLVDLSVPESGLDAHGVATAWAAAGVTVSAVIVRGDGGHPELTDSLFDVTVHQPGPDPQYSYAGLGVDSHHDIIDNEVDTLDGSSSNSVEGLQLTFANPMTSVTVELGALFNAESGMDINHTELALITAYDADGHVLGSVQVSGTANGLVEKTIGGYSEAIARVVVTPVDDGAFFSGNNSDFVLCGVEGVEAAGNPSQTDWVREGSQATLTVSGSFGDVIDISEDHSLLIQVPHESTITGVSAGGNAIAYETITVNSGNAASYPGVAAGTYLKINVDDQLGAGDTSATVQVTIGVPYVSHTVDYTFPVYAVAEEVNHSGSEPDHTDNISISNAHTVAVTVDSAPVANDVSTGVMEGHDDHGHDNEVSGDLLSAANAANTDGFGHLAIQSFTVGTTVYTLGEAQYLTVDTPLGGELTVYADGRYTYEAPDSVDHRQAGSESFSYVVVDSTGSTDPATLTITIGDDAPHFADLDNTTVQENDLADGTSPDHHDLVQHGDVEVHFGADGHGSVAFDTSALPSGLTQDGVAIQFAWNAAHTELTAYTTDANHPVFTVELEGDHYEFTLQQAFDQSGNSDDLTFTVIATDGDGSPTSGTFTVTVEDDAPKAESFTKTVDEDHSININLADKVNEGADDLGGSFAKASDASHGDVTIDAATGVATYVPDANWHGTDHFQYTYTDADGDSVTKEVEVKVTSVNDAPVALGEGYTIAEDGVLVVTTANDLLDNDGDVDGDSLTITGHTDPSHGSLSLNANGTFTYTPAANYHGDDSFTYTVSDGHGGTATATASITVTSVNDAPVANVDSYTVAEDGTLTVTAPGDSLLHNDSDADGDSLTITGFTQPSHGTVDVNADGTFTYTPAAEYSGDDAFTYTVSDGQGGITTGTANITVEPDNAAPVAGDDHVITNIRSATITVPEEALLANDKDADGDHLSVVDNSFDTGWQFAESQFTGGSLQTLNRTGADVFTVARSDFTTVGQPAGTATVLIDGHLADVSSSNSNDEDLITFTLQKGETLSLDIDQKNGGDMPDNWLHMEYRAGTSGSWTSLDNEDSFTAANSGTYQVRIVNDDDNGIWSGGKGAENYLLTATVDYHGATPISAPTYHGDYTVTDGQASDDAAVTIAYQNSQTLTGSEQNDIMLGNDRGVDLDGNGGNDIMYGGAGKDTLSGGSGDDTMYGFGGNDTFYGGDGNDTMSGGAGDDKFYGDNFLGPDGNDTVSYAQAANSVSVDLMDDEAHGDGNDYIADDIENITGSAYNDTIKGDHGSNTLDGGAGNDALYGDRGDDVLFGGAGNDTLRGEEDDDVLRGGAGNDILYGGGDHDRFVIQHDDLSSGAVQYTDVIKDFGHGDTLDLSDVVDFYAGNTATPASQEIAMVQNGSSVNVNSIDTGQTIVVIENQTTTNLALDDQGNITAKS